MTSHIPTLLLREWMQHKRGWLITAFAPPLLFLAMLPFGQVNGLPDDALVTGLIIVMATTLALLAIAAVSAAFQLPGLARRDVQDRSIEFWLSLPSGHTESLMATLLAHVLLAPLAAVALGFGMGYVIAAAVALKSAGFAGLAAIPWGHVVALALPGTVRIVIGVVLALVWLAPLVVLIMATAAWLKRWAMAAITAALVITCAILPKAYGIVAVRDWLSRQLTGAWQALLANPETLAPSPSQLGDVDGAAAWQWVTADLVQVLQAMLSWQVASGLVIAAGGFYLLVLRRRRGG